MSFDAVTNIKVLAILPDRCSGQYEAAPWVADDRHAGIYLGEGRFVWGKFSEVDAAARTCSFAPDDLNGLSMLRPNHSYRFEDDFTGENVEKALDKSRLWERKTFVPSDMMVFPNDNGTSIGARVSSEGPTGGKVVKGGWDHEHCEICFEKIGCAGNQTGYLGTPHAWICEECHNAFVAPKS